MCNCWRRSSRGLLVGQRLHHGGPSPAWWLSTLWRSSVVRTACPLVQFCTLCLLSFVDLVCLSLSLFFGLIAGCVWYQQRKDDWEDEEENQFDTLDSVNKHEKKLEREVDFVVVKKRLDGVVSLVV